MKIEKDKVYLMKLSGYQIKLIQTMIVNSDVRNSLSERGQMMSNILYTSLEEDAEEIQLNKTGGEKCLDSKRK